MSDRDRQWELKLALSSNNSQECFRLLKLIKDPRKVKYFPGNNTVLHHAARLGMLDIVQVLINKYKCHPDCVNDDGDTPLHLAVSYRHLTITDYLITEIHCNPLSKNKKNITPLDTAKTGEFRDIVQLLESALTDRSLETCLITAMKEGGGKIKPCNIIMHGPPGAGKTSLKRVIIGNSPLLPEEQNSTHVFENAVRAVGTSRLTADERGNVSLAEVDNQEIIKMLAKTVKSHHQQTQEESQYKQESQHSYRILQSMANFVTSFWQSDSNHQSSLASLQSSEALRSIKEQLPNVEPSTELFDVNWIHLIDSGGQPQFLDVLPLLFRNESLHIVVTRLDEELDDKPKVRFFAKGKDIYTLPDHLTLSNREFIERACQMAEAQITYRRIVPKVIIVGTNKDKLGRKCEAKLKEINRELTKLHHKYSRVLVRKSADEVIFAVNAMAPDGEERQQYTKELQQCILEAAKDIRVVIDVPLKWFAFHLDLNKTGNIVRKLECYRRGELHGMKNKSVDNALKFFNKFSLLLYCPDDVPDLIFTKIDPLIDRLSMLIKASFIPPGITRTGESDRLRRKGLFNKSFLPTIFEDLYQSGEEFSDNEFLKLLECLKVTAYVADDDYFLPSALSVNPPSNDSSFKSRCIPLVFSWDEQFLPPGFFLTLVVELFQMKHGSSLNLRLRKDVDQCRDVIQVTLAEVPGFVKLMDRKRWIEICYCCSTNEYCFNLQVITSNAIRRVLKRFKHTGIKSPVIGFRCPLCPSDDHCCVLLRDKHMVQCFQCDGPITEDMLCWIEKPKAKLNEKKKLPPAKLVEKRHHVLLPQYTDHHETHEPLQRNRRKHSPHSTSQNQSIVTSHYNAVLSSSCTTSNTTDTSPHHILKSHTSELLGIISNPNKLAIDLCSADLIPYPVKDNVLTTEGRSRLEKSIKLLDEVDRFLKVFNTPNSLVKFCEVLEIQHNPGLTRIADDMLKQLTVITG